MNQSRGGTIFALLIALAAFFVALLAWLAPFSPIGPSPFAPGIADLTAVVNVVPKEPTPTNVSIPTAESPVASVLEPTPGTTAEPPLTSTTESDSTTAPQAGNIRMVMRGGVAVEQVFVPAGSFMMGRDDGTNSEQPVHEVMLDAFWIDQTEVTNAQYEACVSNGVCQPPSNISSPMRDSYYGNPQYANYPVIYVSWDDAQDFSEWVSGRLPTEAEWEYAARGPESGNYLWGDISSNCGLFNFHVDCIGDTSEVSSYPDGASWVGALDMAGNVNEWVYDWFDASYYERAPNTNPTGPGSGVVKVLRGGSWYHNDVDFHAATRYINYPDFREGFDVGFRVVEPLSDPDS